MKILSLIMVILFSLNLLAGKKYQCSDVCAVVSDNGHLIELYSYAFGESSSSLRDAFEAALEMCNKETGYNPNYALIRGYRSKEKLLVANSESSWFLYNRHFVEGVIEQSQVIVKTKNSRVNFSSFKSCVETQSSEEGDTQEYFRNLGPTPVFGR